MFMYRVKILYESLIFQSITAVQSTISHCFNAWLYHIARSWYVNIGKNNYFKRFTLFLRPLNTIANAPWPMRSFLLYSYSPTLSMIYFNSPNSGGKTRAGVGENKQQSVQFNIALKNCFVPGSWTGYSPSKSTPSSTWILLHRNPTVLKIIFLLWIHTGCNLT